VNLVLGWALQVLILATGIYLFLTFLRTPRGGGIVRGLSLTLLIGALSVWVLARLLELEELQHLIAGMAGYVVVILAILFQPELRRGISRVGVHPIVGRLLRSRAPETISEVSRAMVSMAKRKRGALVAFEIDMPLGDYIQSGVEVDAAVHRIHLESIFHPGGALHDGAVIISKNRIASALCLFPLTENVEIAKSTGTRHRAALGLTDECDAVTVVASEETGDISICQNGEMRRKVPHNKLEEILRETLEAEDEREARRATDERPRGWKGVGRFLRSLYTADVTRKLVACGMAVGLIWVAHQNISVSRQISMRIRGQSDPQARPAPGEILVRLPGDDHNLVSPLEGQRIHLEATGTRGRMDRLESELQGLLVIDVALPTEGVDFPLEEVAWSRRDGRESRSLRIRWATPNRPRMRTERYGEKQITLEPRHVEVVDAELDPRFIARPDDIHFDPTSIALIGPAGAIAGLDGEELPVRLQPLVLGPLDTGDRKERLQLGARLRELGFEIKDLDTVHVTLPIDPAPRDLPPVEREIAVVCMSPEQQSELSRWSLPPATGTARFRIRTRGILPASAESGSEAVRERSAAVVRFVEENLDVFVDIADREPGGRQVPVRHAWRSDWREALALDLDALAGKVDLWVELETDAEVLLIERKQAESPGPPEENG